MPPKGQRRDPNLDCPAVVQYRETIRLQMNYLQRQFVVDKVSCCERGLAIWRGVLRDHMLHGYNPRNIPFMVQVWESSFWNVDGARFQAYKPTENGVNGNGNH